MCQSCHDKTDGVQWQIDYLRRYLQDLEAKSARTDAPVDDVSTELDKTRALLAELECSQPEGGSW